MSEEEMKERFPSVFEAMKYHENRVNQLKDKMYLESARHRPNAARLQGWQTEIDYHFTLYRKLQEPIIDAVMHSQPKPIYHANPIGKGGKTMIEGWD